MRLLFILIAFAQVCRGSPVRDVVLPLWYEKANCQIYRLELNDLKTERVQLELPCAVCATNTPLSVANGCAAATLVINLHESARTFPITVLTWDESGRRVAYLRLSCHLSLVPFRHQATVRGNRFAITNLTDEPLQVGSCENLTLEKNDGRVVTGILKGKATLVLQGRPIILDPEKPGNFNGL